MDFISRVVEMVDQKDLNGKKELFKLEIPYNKEFWETQNQLPLTNEMRNFINKAHN